MHAALQWLLSFCRDAAEFVEIGSHVGIDDAGKVGKVFLSLEDIIPQINPQLVHIFTNNSDDGSNFI